MMKKIFEYLKNYIRSMTDHHLYTHGASSAFSVFVCCLPFLCIVLSLVPTTPITEERLVAVITYLFPNSVDGFVSALIDELYQYSFNVLPVSVLVLFYTSSRAVVFIRQGLNEIYETKEKRNFILVRVLAMVFMIIAVLLIVAVSFVGVLSVQAEDMLTSKGIDIQWLTTVTHYQPLVIIVFLTFVFSVFYAVVPTRKSRLKEEIPGALPAAIGCWLILSGFDLVLDHFVSFTVYGSLATVMIILLYFELFFDVFFAGALLNAMLQRNKQKIKGISEH